MLQENEDDENALTMKPHNRNKSPSGGQQPCLLTAVSLGRVMYQRKCTQWLSSNCSMSPGVNVGVATRPVVMSDVTLETKTTSGQWVDAGGILSLAVELEPFDMPLC